MTKSTEELLSLNYRLVRQESIMVNREGDVWKKVDDGMWIKASLFSDKKNYIKFSARIQGKSQQIYLHHVIAEAFVPNPEKYKKVAFKDGNRQHVYADNLVWGHGVGGRQRKKYGCSICGSTKETRCNPFICTSCISKRKKEEKKKENAEKVRKELMDLDPRMLNTRQREVYDLAMQGMSISQIGRELGLSRQNVYNRFSRIRKKAKSANDYLEEKS